MAENIGYEKITLLHSPVCKYGMLTSNNVESTHARMINLGNLPIVELLLGIESMILTDRHNDWLLTQRWTNVLGTQYLGKIFEKHSTDSANQAFTFKDTSSNQFLVNSQVPHSMTFQVGLRPGQYCSCGFFQLYLYPCVHMFYVMQSRNLGVEQFLCSTWKKEALIEASIPLGEDYPVTLLSELNIHDDLREPVVTRNSGRPKRKRYESQQATQDLEERPKRVKKCGRCNIIGHNRRSCTALEP